MADVKAKSLGIPGLRDHFIKFSLVRFSSSDEILNIDLDCTFSSK